MLLLVAGYYDRHGSPNEQMEAHYLLGCAYRDMGEAPQALQCFNDAMECADTNNGDLRLLARIHGQAGDLYRKEGLLRSAIQEYITNSRYAWQASDTLTALLASGQLGSCYYGLAMPDSALDAFRDTRTSLLKYGFDDIADSFLSTPIYILLSHQKYKEAKVLLSLYEKSIRRQNQNAIQNPTFHLLYYYKGLLFEGIGKPDSALYYYQRLSSEGMTANNIGLAYKGLFSVYKSRSNGDSVIKYASLYVSHLDSMASSFEQSKLQSVQGLYNYSRQQRKAEHEALKASEFRQKFIISLAVLALGMLITSLAFVIIKSRNRRKLHVLSSLNAMTIMEYSSLKTELRQMKQQEEVEQSKYDALYADYERTKKILTSLQTDNKAPDEWNLGDSVLNLPVVKKFHKIASTLSIVSDSDWQDLREMTKEYMPNFLATINSNNYKLNRRETDLCILIRLRFIPSEISILLNMSKSNLSNTRKRLLSRMFDTEGTSKDFDERINAISR